jgi:hypothetical protein
MRIVNYTFIVDASSLYTVQYTLQKVHVLNTGKLPNSVAVS